MTTGIPRNYVLMTSQLQIVATALLVWLAPALVSASDPFAIDLAALRKHRKHLRTMHQRRPELYEPLTHDVTAWQRYPDIPWIAPECPDYVNKAQLPPPD